jgi:hypothetical protein
MYITKGPLGSQFLIAAAVASSSGPIFGIKKDK